MDLSHVVAAERIEAALGQPLDVRRVETADLRRILRDHPDDLYGIACSAWHRIVTARGSRVDPMQMGEYFRTDDPRLAQAIGRVIGQPLLKGFEVVNAVKMPGTVTAVDGYAAKEGRTASSKVTEEQIKKFDDLKKTMTKAKRKVTCGKDEADADKAAFLKELAEAKAAWPALKKELLAEAEKNKKDKESKGMDD